MCLIKKETKIVNFSIKIFNKSLSTLSMREYACYTRPPCYSSIETGSPMVTWGRKEKPILFEPWNLTGQSTVVTILKNKINLTLITVVC